MHALLVNVPDEFARAGLARSGVVGGFRRGGGGHGGFVVEAVEVATSGLELLDPFLGLYIPKSEKQSVSCLRRSIGHCDERLFGLYVPLRSSCGSRMSPGRWVEQDARRGSGSC